MPATVNTASNAASFIKDNYRDLALTVKEKSVTCAFKPSRAEKIKPEAVEPPPEIFRTRLNGLGVEEISILGDETDSCPNLILLKHLERLSAESDIA